MSVTPLPTAVTRLELTPQVSVGIDRWHQQDHDDQSAYQGSQTKLGLKALWRVPHTVDPFVAASFVLGQSSQELSSPILGATYALINRRGLEFETGVEIDKTDKGNLAIPVSAYVQTGQARGLAPLTGSDQFDDLKNYSEAGLKVGLNINRKDLHFGFYTNWGRRTYFGQTPGYASSSLNGSLGTVFGLGFSIGWTPARKKLINTVPVIQHPQPSNADPLNSDASTLDEQTLDEQNAGGTSSDSGSIDSTSPDSTSPDSTSPDSTSPDSASPGEAVSDGGTVEGEASTSVVDAATVSGGTTSSSSSSGSTKPSSKPASSSTASKPTPETTPVASTTPTAPAPVAHKLGLVSGPGVHLNPETGVFHSHLVGYLPVPDMNKMLDVLTGKDEKSFNALNPNHILAEGTHYDAAAQTLTCYFYYTYTPPPVETPFGSVDVDPQLLVVGLKFKVNVSTFETANGTGYKVVYSQAGQVPSTFKGQKKPFEKVDVYNVESHKTTLTLTPEPHASGTPVYKFDWVTDNTMPSADLYKLKAYQLHEEGIFQIIEQQTNQMFTETFNNALKTLKKVST